MTKRFPAKGKVFATAMAAGTGIVGLIGSSGFVGSDLSQVQNDAAFQRSKAARTCTLNSSRPTSSQGRVRVTHTWRCNFPHQAELQIRKNRNLRPDQVIVSTLRGSNSQSVTYSVTQTGTCQGKGDYFGRIRILIMGQENFKKSGPKARVC